MNLIVGKGIRTAGRIRAGIVNWWHEYSKSKIGVVGLIIFIGLVAAVLLAPVLSTHDPDESGDVIYAYDENGVVILDQYFNPTTVVDERLNPPSSAHLLGTDDEAKDLWSALLYAGRNSMAVGLITASAIVIFATLLGLLAGYYGGIIDELIMRIADIMMVLPRMPLLIVLTSILAPTIYTIMIVIFALGWTRPARQIRALTMSLKNYDYVESTKASGGSSLHIIFHHIFPNVSGIVVAHLVTETVQVILLESGLSFLGLGDPLRLTWGQILHNAQGSAAMSGGYWWWWIPTGLCLTAVCFSLAFIGTTINDRFVLKLNVRGKD